MSGDAPGLDEVRRRLRAQGYLDSGIERLIFGAGGAVGVLWPAAVTGAIAFGAAPAAAALYRGTVVPAWGAAVLWAILGLLSLVATSLGCLGWYALSRRLPVPERPARASLALSVAAVASVAGLFAAGVRSLATGPAREPLLAVLALAVAAFYFGRAVRASALALALRRSPSADEGRPRFRVSAAAAAAVLTAAALATTFDWSRRPPARPIAVAPSSDRVHVIGLDGVSPEALAILAPGAPVAAWTRRAAPPPQIWTTIATGVGPARHGVSDFEHFSMARAFVFSPPTPVRWLARGPAVAAGLVRRLPLAADERRVRTFWEVAAASGIPTVAVDWWASDAVDGADVIDNRAMAESAGSGSEIDARSIGAYDAAVLKRRARLAALYLPGADIDGGSLSPAARALVAREFAAARRGEFTLAIVADAGRAGQRGAIALAGPGVGAACGVFRPEDLAPTVLARLGVPAASDLAGAPARGCFLPGALSGETVPTYGDRGGGGPRSGPRPGDAEYLRRLRALGYLQ